MKTISTFLTLLLIVLGSQAQNVNVTFKVDMNQYSASTFTGVFVNGTFNGWCGSCNPMTDADMDGVWEVQLPLPTDTIEYKFTLDGWTGQENLTQGTICTVTNGGFTNRGLIITADTVLPEVCWESCQTCSSTPPPANVTFKVDMNQYSATTFTGVFVNGTFNGWCGSCNPMTDADMDGVWEVQLPLTSSTIEYKFTLDGWTGEENLTQGTSCTVTNGGFTNRELTFSADTVLPAVCWESCQTCAVVPPASSDVTFSVNMNDYSGAAFTGVFLNGTFNGWCGSCNPMTDADMDGVWEVQLPLNMGDTIEYKYTLDGWTGQENLDSNLSCVVTNNGFTNRVLMIGGDTTLGTVCYEDCSDCSSAPSGSYDITFQVDMNDFTGTFTTPELNGDFNSWCGNCAVMTDADQDGIWDITVNITSDSIEYKFSADNWGVQENLAPGTSCTKTTGAFTNRFMMVTGDTVLPPVCWGSCAACTGVSSTANVTFQVDMSKYTGSYTDVNLNGTFNNWCGGCAIMTDADQDLIYTLEVTVPTDSIEFKFTVDAWTDDETLDSTLACVITTDGFTNRLLDVTGDTVLPAVCWESCEDCVVGIDDLSNGAFAFYPNPASDYLQIEGDFSGSDTYRVEFVNVLGKQMLTKVLSSADNNMISTDQLDQGIYMVSVYSGDKKVALQRVIISR